MSPKPCISRRNVVLSTGFAAAAGVLSAAGGRQARAATKPYHIALSNSYIGNQWRIEMVNLTQAYAKKYHPNDVVLSVTSSGVEVQKQIAAIDEMISRGVNAILINPASESGLNPVIAQAAQRGIVVVDFDHAVSAPSAYKVHVDFVKFGEIQAKWLAETLQGKGGVIINRGVPGFEGDPGLRQPAPQVRANDRRGFQWLAPGMLKYKDQGLKGISVGDPPALGAYALKVAVEILEGRGPKDKDIVVGIPP